ncbi:MAG: PH domain-containing protein [Propionibacteriaceae bacterium]
MLDPKVTAHLIADEGEIIVDEVHKHWAAAVPAIGELVLAALIMVIALWLPTAYFWFPVVVVALPIVLHAGWRILGQHMDRFVITNMRVFRVRGILSQHIATMPMSRILDISVHKPLVGRILNYGHFVFESAAQDQGLKEIRFVGSPDQRDLTIQRVIQRSGLRASMRPPGVHADVVPSTGEDGEP